MSITLMSLSSTQSLLTVFSQPQNMHFLLGPLCLALRPCRRDLGEQSQLMLDPTFPFPIPILSALPFRVQQLQQLCTPVSTSPVQCKYYELGFYLLCALSRSLKTVSRHRDGYCVCVSFLQILALCLLCHTCQLLCFVQCYGSGGRMGNLGSGIHH